ncbi:hypothetical protein TRVA0_003S00298 [Trichomonascus vanleenenianus]|uniref:KilA-N domain-containing protein n=1 Tax=Trichomonascus vanleenenianus TaxID=2268995 RepID=UPI003ECA3BD9
MASVTTAPQTYRLNSPLVGVGYQQSQGYASPPTISGFNGSSLQYFSNGFVIPHNYVTSTNSGHVPVDYYTTTPPIENHVTSQSTSKQDSNKEKIQADKQPQQNQVLTSTEKRDPPINPPSPRCNRKILVPKSFASKPRVTTTLWEDEGTLCFQVEARGVCVARREDNNMVNGTKLLNVAGMTRGRRDGILKTEKVRHVVKIGAMHLKGVWVPFERALAFANKEKITDLLYPLFVHDIKKLLYHPPIELARSISVTLHHSSDENNCKTCDSLTGQSVKKKGGSPSIRSISSLIASQQPADNHFCNTSTGIAGHQDSESPSISLSTQNSSQKSTHASSFGYSKPEHELTSTSSGTGPPLAVSIAQQNQTQYFSGNMNGSTSSWTLQFPLMPMQSHQPIPRSASTPMISFQNTFPSQPGYPQTQASSLSIDQPENAESMLNGQYGSTSTKARSDEKLQLKRMKSDHL